MPLHVEVDREHLRTVRVLEDAIETPGSGEVVLSVESFALTANNVTYAVMGGAMRYWDFFPASEPQWGRVPVWGFGRVVESSHPDVSVDQRVYGYLPMSTHLTVTPGRVDAGGFVDIAEHRQPMAAVYSRYQYVPHDGPPSRPAPDHDESVRALLHPLFVTGYLIVDSILDDAGPADAPVIVVSSASSKTALGVAWSARRAGLSTVGVTSPSRVEALERLGVWDRVIGYPHVVDLDPSEGSQAFVDIAGDAAVTQAVRRALGRALVRSIGVGLTHWEPSLPPGAGDGAGDSVSTGDGASHEMFFAPTRIAKRASDWGRAELDRRLGLAWSEFAASTDDWLRIEVVDGPAAITDAWRRLLDADVSADVGIIGVL